MKTTKIVLLVFIVFIVILIINLFYLILRNNNSIELVSHLSASLPVVIGVSESLSPRVKFCPNVVKPLRVIKNNKFWQTVVNKNVYLFSSYYDNRYEQNNVSYHHIRTMAAIRSQVSDLTFYCYLWTNESNRPLIVSVISQEMWSHFWSRDDPMRVLFKAYLMSCPVPKHYHNRVIAVSISDRQCSQAINYLEVKPSVEHEERRDFAVCVKPLNFSKDISIRLIEWIEFQLLLGADLIQFYTYSIDHKTQKLLDYYRSVGRVRTEFISLPGAQPNSPRIRSQYLSDNVWQKRRMELISYNDCLYRHLYSHRYVVLLDLDEANVPRIHSNWKQMIDYITQLEPNANLLYSSFAAQNVYFFGSLNKKIAEQNRDQRVSNDLVISNHMIRSANFSAPGFAVKSFVSTSHTLVVFNHYSLIPLYSNMSRYSLISKSVAQLNHYREDCPKTMLLECEQDFMKFWQKDNIVLKFKSQLINRIEFVIKLTNS